MKHIGGLAVAATSILTACSAEAPAASERAHMCLEETGHEVLIAAATFLMGDDQTYRNEAPAHNVTVDAFFIDAHEVTNRQFSAFVAATGYVTVAERMPDPALLPGAPSHMLQPGSAVFTPPSPDGAQEGWWSYIPGATWRHPEGPNSSIAGKDAYPVVQIAYEDADAYARWAGRALPTEAQFELAARSRHEAETYAWGGQSLTPNGHHRANTWQGIFPVINTGEDGYSGLAPVGCFQANDYGAYDLIGNAWEWTANWYAPQHNPLDTDNPSGPSENASHDPETPGFPVRVLKGGSYLCAANFCMRYRPAARHAQDTGLGSNHIGFRTVRRPDDAQMD